MQVDKNRDRPKPETDEHGETSNMNCKIAICITAILLIWITGLLFWLFVLRDTWEVDNSQKIINMIDEIKALDQTNKKEEAVAKYDELLLFLGGRKIKNSEISKLISDVNATTYETRIILNTPKYIALIADFEKEAKVLISDGNFPGAKKKYEEALNVIEKCEINSPELNTIKKRMLDSIKFTEEKEQQHQLAELHERQEALRQAAAKDAAKKRIEEITSNLPSLQDVLQTAKVNNIPFWKLWEFGLQLYLRGIKLGVRDKEHEDSLKEYLLEKTEIIKRIQAADAGVSPFLIAYRDEILDIIENVEWSWSNVGNIDNSNSNYIPIEFAVYHDELVIMLGTIFTDTVFNNINQSFNTPKKRASYFIQNDVIPSLSKTKLPEKLKNARFGYLGIMFIYGNRNFVKEESSTSAEALGILISPRDLVDFVNRDISQEAFLSKSSVYIASETSEFIKVEITLE